MVKKKEKTEEKVEKNNFDLRKINIWVVSTIALSLLLVVLIWANLGFGGNKISKQEAGEILKEFASLQGANIEIKDIKETSGLYEVNFIFMGQEGKYYVSKDGKYVGSMIEFKEIKESFTEQAIKETQKQQTIEAGYSEEDLKKLEEFNKCLSQKGVKIYGANWCGWTQRWVSTLGGSKAVSPIYVECTENENLCNSENIRGYPTTKINGKEYSGPRTIEAIGKEVGCPIPNLTGEISSINSQNTASQC